MRRITIMQASHKPHNTSYASSDKPVIGVLLVHGLNGSRRDLAELETILQDQGMLTTNMLLPGHGVHVREMLPLGWQEWSAAVRDELNDLKQRCDLVFLVGHSLGGALALHTAAHTEVAGIVTMCAPLHMHPLTHMAVRVARRFTPLLPTIREDVHDPEARRRYTRDVYHWTPVRPVESMLQFLPTLRAELPSVASANRGELEGDLRKALVHSLRELHVYIGFRVYLYFGREQTNYKECETTLVQQVSKPPELDELQPHTSQPLTRKHTRLSI